MTTTAAYGIHPTGYRLPAALAVGAVRLQVGDLERSLAWYGEVLGLRVLSRDDAGRARVARLAAHGDERVLVELRERPGARPVPRRGRLGLYHFAILLPDRAALGRFVAHLGRIGERVGASDHLVSEALYLHDPDGLGIEVYADRPREAWRTHPEAEGPQLVMATEPLDVDAVVRAAGGAAWDGMPAGTVMGHVHLHVGDIAEARAFYPEALGLDVVVWSYPGALFLSAGGYHHHLGLNTWAGPGALPAAEDEAKLLEWTLHLPSTDDVRAAARSLEAAGHAARDAANGAVTVADPWGTVLRLEAAG